MAQANGSVGSDTAYLDSNASPSSKLSTTDLRGGDNAIAAAANPTDDPHEQMTSDSTLEKAQGAPEEKRSVTGFKWFCAYSSILATVFLFAIDGTIVADLQPSILDSIGGVDKLPWIGAATSLGTLCILPHGKVFAVFNIKWYFLSCVLGFEGASALCGGAPTMNALIVGRAMLGVFGSGVYSGALVLIAVTTTSKERPLYFAGVIAMWGLGSVLGPVIGGAFAISSATWRWGFYINLPIGALFAPAFLFCLPNVNPRSIPMLQKLRSQDWVGIVVFLAGSAFYVMAIAFGGTQFAFNSGPQIAFWVLTGVFLIAFVAVTYFHPGVPLSDRLYPAHLMKKLEIVNLQYQVFQCTGGVMMTVYYVPLLFQFTRGDGALDAGVRLLPLVFMMVFFAILNGWAMPKFGYYMPWYVFGNIMILIGSALMFIINSSTGLSNIYGYTVLIGIGTGSFLTAGLSIAQNMVDAADMTNVVGFMTVAQNLGVVTYLAVAGAIFQNIGAQKLQAALPNASQDQVLELTTGTNSDFYRSLSQDQQHAVIEQVTLAIRNVFALMMVGSALGLILSGFLGRRKSFQ